LNAAGRSTTTVATGDPIRAQVQYVAHQPIPDALIELYFVSMFGNLHTHFSTDVPGERLELPPGPGTIEFVCPEILLEVAAFTVEVSIRERGASFNEHLDHKQLSVLNVRKGKPIHGLFHTPHSFRRLS
jgi:hypothetical protein